MSELSTRAQRVAASAMWRVAPWAAALLAGTAIAAVVLVPAGLWRPAVVWPVLFVVAAAAWQVAAMVPLRPVHVPAAWACVGVAVAHGCWAAATHSEHLVLRRDAGSYALYAHWIATRGGLPVDVDLAAFGGHAALADPAFTLDSPAFYQVAADGGAHVVPQFLVGAPAWFGLGWWVGGWEGLFIVPAVTSALAVLAFAGVLARVVSPWWAVVGTATLAGCQPVLHAARSTYSEPAALLLVLVAAGLLIDAVARAGDRLVTLRLGTVGGLLLGLAGLVRVDSLREVALLLPVLGLVAVRGAPRAAAGAAAGVGVGTAIAAAAALVLSRPYLDDISDSLIPLMAITVGLAVIGAAIVVLSRRASVASARSAEATGAASSWRARLPQVAAWSVALGWLALLTRPWWMTAKDDPASPVSQMVKGFQIAEGLPLVEGRTYAEDSLIWVGWWLGPVAVLACIAATVVAGRILVGAWFDARAVPPPWAAPLIVGLGSTVMTLWRPGITPDHPWADRRLVPVVLPFVVATAVVAAARLGPATRGSLGGAETPPERDRRAASRSAVSAFVGAVTLGWALSATVPVAVLRTEHDQPRAVDQVCDALSADDVVLAVDPRGYNEWVQVVRGVCDVPAAAIRPPGDDTTAAAVDRAAQRARAEGRRVVLLSAEPGTDLAALGGRVTTTVHLDTREDQRLLERRPLGWSRLSIDVRLAVRAG